MPMPFCYSWGGEFDADPEDEPMTNEELDDLIDAAEAGEFGPDIQAEFVPEDADDPFGNGCMNCQKVLSLAEYAKSALCDGCRSLGVLETPTETVQVDTSKTWLERHSICPYCYEDHDLEDCPEAKELADMEVTEPPIDDMWSLSGITDYYHQKNLEAKQEPEPEFYEDENKVLIPTDPTAPCYDRAGGLFTCSCKNAKHKYECKEHGVGREWNSHAWRPWRKDGEYNVAKRNKQAKAKAQKQKGWEAKNQGTPKTKVVASQADKAKAALDAHNKAKDSAAKIPSKPIGYKPPSTTPTKPAVNAKGSGAASATSGYGAYGGYGKDRHYDDEYVLWDGVTVIHCSSSWNNRKEGDFIPDFGLYFDWGWHPWWRNEHIAWPDYNIPENFIVAYEQLLCALEKAQAGLAVEMGCIGAHGRTGTALAVINVMLGAEPKEAIAHVRKNHCEHAIESDIQEWWVEWVYCNQNGLPLPSKPVYVPKYQTTKTTSTVSTSPKGNTTHSKRDHFEMWVWSPLGSDMVCPGKKDCGYWEEDVDEYLKGKYPTWSTGNGYGAINLADSMTVHGFIVPKAKPPTTKYHNLNQKDGCKCEACRYLDSGRSAFLCPSEIEGKKAHILKLNELEEDAIYHAADRKGAEAAALVASKTDGDATKPADMINLTTIFAAKTPTQGTLGLAQGPPAGTVQTPYPKTDTYPKKLHPESEGIAAISVVDLDGGDQFLKIAAPDGTIIEVPIHPDFKKHHPIPPTIPGQEPKDGDRSGEFVWVAAEGGWVAEIIGVV